MYVLSDGQEAVRQAILYKDCSFLYSTELAKCLKNFQSIILLIT